MHTESAITLRFQSPIIEAEPVMANRYTGREMGEGVEGRPATVHRGQGFQEAQTKRLSQWRTGSLYKTVGLIDVRLWLAGFVLAIAWQAGAAQPPTVSVGASQIAETSASITGTINPNGADTAFHVVWGMSSAYGETTFYTLLPATNTPVPMKAELIALSPNTTYHYQVVATNSAGMTVTGDQTFTTLSASTNWEGDFAYVVNNGTIAIIAYRGTGGDLTIPASIAGLPVTSLGNQAFFGLTNLTSVSFPATLTSIGELAFSGCTGLTTFTVPNSVTNLAGATFAGCTGLESVTLSTNLAKLDNDFIGCFRLASIVVPDSVIHIYGRAFFDCGSLTNVVIGTGVVSIARESFGGCSNLPSLGIPASATNIDLNLFVGEPNAISVLKAINVDSHNTTYSSVDGVLLDKAQTTLLLYPRGRQGNYVMPASVIIIDEYAFNDCGNLSGILIGTNVTTIGGASFAGCAGLTTLALPDSVTHVEDGLGSLRGAFFGAFTSCTSLTNVIIGKGLSYLGLGTFTLCRNLLAVYFEGNAPTPGLGLFGLPDVFGSADLVTVFYLPRTTGWGPTYAGRPTMLWNPQVQTSDGSFGLQQNQFGFNIAGTPGIPLVVEASLDPAANSWIPLQNCALTNGLLYFSDPQWVNYSKRFYRIRSP